MGISITGGVKVPQGKFSVGPAALSGFRFWRLETTTSGSVGNGTSISELKMTFDASSNLLDSFTLTSIGGEFDAEFPITKINDTIAEIVNADSIGFVPVANGFMDFYVDFGIGNEKEVSVYSIAPQAIVAPASTLGNTTTGFKAHKSNNAIDWTLVKEFTSISTGSPDWLAGVFRDFDLTT